MERRQKLDSGLEDNTNGSISASELVDNAYSVDSEKSQPSLVTSSFSFLATHKWELGLLGVALATRLPLMSISLDEVDSANFYNALVYGYDITNLRPHPPGYPVYMFMAWGVNSIVNNPLLSLTLLSAILGSLAIIPFYLLLREFAGTAIGVVGSLLFLVSPLYWALSEAALSDVPSMFFVLLTAWLAYRGRLSDTAFLLACVTASLAVGIRQPNIVLLPIFAVPLAYRAIYLKQMPLKVGLVGAGLFVATSLTWLVTSVFVGAGGISSYLNITLVQYSAAVSIWDVTRLEEPWLTNTLMRVERFLTGYFLNHSWTGSNAETNLGLLLIAPWVIGFGLFVTSFNYRDPRHIFLVAWMAGILYVILVIHFLPRYGLPQLPAFAIAALMGYRFLGEGILRHPKRWEILLVAGIGSVLTLFAIKIQPHVWAFEFRPPIESQPGFVIFIVSMTAFIVANRMYRSANVAADAPSEVTFSLGNFRASYASVVLAALAIIAVPYGIRGYSISSIASEQVSPNQQMVEYVKSNFPEDQVVSCLDWQTNSFFVAFMPEAPLMGLESAEGLLVAHQEGNVLVASQLCLRFWELNARTQLRQVATFTGSSPLWAKSPIIALYVAESAAAEER